VDQATIERCRELIGYSFSNPKLLELALTHASVAPTRLQSNERLEFLGDAVLGLVVCHELYRKQEKLLEGELTTIKSAVVSRQTCAQITRDSELYELVRLGKGMPEAKSLPQSVAAAVFEAVIGAIYLDGGLEPARRFILKHIGPRVDGIIDSSLRQNYKSLLQQYSQRRLNCTPGYVVLDEKGPDHSKCFEVAATLNGQHFPSAWGNTKKQAEQQAALNALIELGVLE